MGSTPIMDVDWPARAGSLAKAGGVTLLLFSGLVPLGQWFRSEPKPPDPRGVEVAALPPKPEEKSSPIPSKLELREAADPMQAVREVWPEPLDVGMPRPGSVPGGFADGNPFPVKLSGVEGVSEFAVAELDRMPRLLGSPARFVPFDLIRDGIRGQVRLRIRIDPTGAVEVRDVVSTDHERLVLPARRFAEKCRFEAPLHQGKPVSTAFVFPISF